MKDLQVKLDKLINELQSLRAFFEADKNLDPSDPRTIVKFNEAKEKAEASTNSSKEWDSSFFFLSEEYGQKMEWKKWMKEIPFIPWPDDLEVQFVPPFAGAMVRAKVRRVGEEKEVSIYLDCHGSLGFYNGPYWEIYPHKGDTFRCGIKDVDSLHSALKEALE